MRTRLPVKLKIAVVTAALTFVILCLFAVVIGAVAEERVHDAFDDDLRATAADIANRLDPEFTPAGAIEVDGDELIGAASGDAEVRVIRANGQVRFPPDGVPLGDPASQGLGDVGDYRVASRALTISNRSPGEQFIDPLSDQRFSRTVGFVQYAKPQDTTATTINRIRLFLAFGVLGGTLLAFIAGLHVAQRAMRPIAGLTRAAREVARTRDPDIKLPSAPRQRRGRRPGPHLRGHAAGAERRARRDGGHARSPARVRGGRLARASHAAHEHSGQPRAAGVRAGGRASRDGRVRAALVAAHAAAGRPTCCCSPGPTPDARCPPSRST